MAIRFYRDQPLPGYGVNQDEPEKTGRSLLAKIFSKTQNLGGQIRYFFYRGGPFRRGRPPK